GQRDNTGPAPSVEDAQARSDQRRPQEECANALGVAHQPNKPRVRGVLLCEECYDIRCGWHLTCLRSRVVMVQRRFQSCNRQHLADVHPADGKRLLTTILKRSIDYLTICRSIGTSRTACT